MGWTEAALAFLRYGKTFQETRKIYQQQLSRKSCVVFQESQLQQASILARGLLATPDKFEGHLQRYAPLNVNQ